ncbi:hypothetical protein DL762_003264 [Monosporascus cannonballus]|uniref:FAD-binding domain-containing protein n=1 Tax=Monosporascus cannonballus TaxID=155416 RepID=A0ABY0HB53_9PEZI|nr:hypothetical protein DL762_003264 [Monosporascus cannonballus]
MTTSSKQHILVIGAGVTGLLIAQGLQQAGIPFTVFEAEAGADVARSREWQMILHWALPLAMKLLPEHLAVQLKERASVDSSLDFDVYPNNILRFYNGVDGAILAELPIKNRCIRVARKKLRALCADGVEIKYGHILKAVRVDEDRGEVTAKFSNGHEATGTLLIGCDGAKSFVRQYLLGSAKASITPLDVSFWNVIVSYPNAERALHIRSAHPIFAMVARPGIFGFLGTYDVPDPEKPETWRFHLAISFPRDENVNPHTLSNAERHAVMKEKGARLCEPFRTAILGIPEEVAIPTDDIGYWAAERWDTRGGLITLAGDAAHPMTPHRGQGCNNATQDAYNLVDSIKRIDAGGDQHRLIQECSDEIVKRGAAETKLSLETAYAFLDWDKLQASPLFKHSLSARH